MVNYYASNDQYKLPLNDCLRQFYNSYNLAPQPYGGAQGLQFGGGNASGAHWNLPADFYTPQYHPQYTPQYNPVSPVCFGNQNPAPKTMASPKMGWFKKMLIGAGLAAGIYFFGKKAAGFVSTWMADKVAAKVSAQIAESFKPAEAAKKLGEACSTESSTVLLDTLKKIGFKPENISGFLTAQSGQGAGKPDFRTVLVKNTLLNVAGKYLPEPAVKMLEKQATPDNIRWVLDTGLLSNALKYSGDWYGQIAGHVRNYLKINADAIADPLARLTGFQKKKITDCLEQFT